MTAVLHDADEVLLGFTREAAQAIAGAGMGMLAALADRSLIKRTSSTVLRS